MFRLRLSCLGFMVCAVSSALHAQNPPTPQKDGMPALTPGPTVTLSQVLAAAEARNLTLALARTEIDKAEAQLAQAWGLLLPAISGQATYTHNDHADTFDPTASLAPLLSNLGMTPPEGSELVVRPQDEWRAGAQVSMPIIHPQGWLGVSAARRGAEWAALSVAAARERLLLAAAQAYWVAVVNRELVSIHESQLRASRDHLAVAQSRRAAGDALRIDVVRAETEVERAREDLLSAHLALDNARDALATLTGMEELPMPADPPALPAPPEAKDSELDNVLSRRADLRAAGAAVAVAERQVLASWMQFLPVLTGSAQTTYLFSDPPDLGSSDRSRWAALLTLSVPIYNEVRYADLDSKRAALRQATLREAELKRNAALEVRRAQRDYLVATSSAQIAARQVKLTHEALALTEAAFKNGAGTSLEVADAQRALRTAELGAATQRLRAQMALLTLLNALGQDLGHLGSR